MAQNAHNPIDRMSATLALDAPVTTVKLVSASRARALAKLGVTTVRDLVSLYPRRYIDLSQVKTVAAARVGDACTIVGNVHAIESKRLRNRSSLVTITLVDGTGTLMVSCFRQQWLMNNVAAGMRIAVAGTLEFNYGYKRMTNPHLVVMEEGDAASAGMVIPVHPLTGEVKAGMMRRFIANALDATCGVIDPLPLNLRMKYRLMGRNAALQCIHFPHDMDEQREARRRLAYEEVLHLELMLMQEGEERSRGLVPTEHIIDGEHLAAFRKAIPFELTGEQQVAVGEILAVLAAPRVGNHMLLGDVGTGKTLVAAHCLAVAADTGTQVLFMAPTELLARQHFASLSGLLAEAGVKSDVLTSATTPDDRERIIVQLATGELDVLFGTHALLEEDVQPKAMSIAIIDEQQRFGVDQRAALLQKGACPDALFLTATPIPRTLALALYGNLTLSYLKTRPKTSAPRQTFVHDYKAKGAAYDAARAALERGERVFVVCPLVGEKRAESPEAGKGDGAADEPEELVVSIESDQDMLGSDIHAAEEQARFLSETVFADYEVGLVHGRMPAREKQQIMQDFRDGKLQVLVATTVIEVGIDVPEATVMIVEDADRFGLSQLHQLRGRVGRGTLPGEVHLISGTRNPAALERLAAMERTDDGFELATYDLALRREGDILGNRQHGASVLKLVNVVRDGKMIEAAHDDARAILAEDPLLESAANRALGREARLAFKRAEEITGG